MKIIIAVKISIVLINVDFDDFTSPFLSFCFDWEYLSNTRDSISSAIKTPRISSKLKYSAARRIFNSLLGVSISRWNSVPRVCISLINNGASQGLLIFLFVYFFVWTASCDLVRFSKGYFQGSGIVHRGFMEAIRVINRYAYECKVKVSFVGRRNARF